MITTMQNKMSMFESLASFSKFFWVKFLGAFVAFAGIELIALSDDDQKAIKALVVLVLVDSILGVWTALKMKRLASWRMGQPMARKVILYAIAGVTVYSLGGAYHTIFGWAPIYVIMFFAVSETLSIFEKLSLLGLQLPMKLVSRVNETFQRMAYGDEKAKQEVVEKK